MACIDGLLPETLLNTLCKLAYMFNLQFLLDLHSRKKKQMLKCLRGTHITHSQENIPLTNNFLSIQAELARKEFQRLENTTCSVPSRLCLSLNITSGMCKRQLRHQLGFQKSPSQSFHILAKPKERSNFSFFSFTMKITGLKRLVREKRIKGPVNLSFVLSPSPPTFCQ